MNALNVNMYALLMSKTDETSKLNAKLEAASNLKVQSEKNMKDQCDITVRNIKDRYDSQLAVFKDSNNKLENHFNETLSAKMKDFRETIDLKMSEIENLLAELQSKKDELNQKDLKIKTLEGRIKNCNCENCQW